MRLMLILAALAVSGTYCQRRQQNGFLANLFGANRRPPRNPQFANGIPNGAPRPQQQGFRPPPPNFRGARPQPQPQLQPQPQPNRPVPQQFQGQRSPQQPFQQGRPPVRQQNVRPSRPKPACPGPAYNGCPGACKHHTFKGRDYIITWKIDVPACSNFTGEEAEEYCVRQGGHAVSLDTNDYALEMERLAIQDAKRYFWTGGRINHDAGVVTWPSGSREGYVKGERFWSPTGALKLPQPDNRDGNEICIGVLNNFYADGVKWHDVACHHRKPTICEV